jgi:hypothetical protein
MLSGREKAGKGYLEAYLLGCLERGDTTILGPSSVGAQRALIYTEEPVQSLKEKYDLFDVSKAMVVYQWELAHLPWAEVVAWLVENAERLGCGIIMIDNISDATGTSEESGKELANHLRPLSNKAKESGLAILIDHHMRKTGGRIEDLIRGSTAVGALVDVIVGLEKDGRGRERKLTSWGRLWATNWEKQVELSEDKTTYNLLDGDFRQRILVSRDMWTAKDYAKAINATEETAHTYLSEHPLVEKRERAAENGAHLYIVTRPPDLS